MGRRGGRGGPYRVAGDDDDEDPAGTITARGRALDDLIRRLEGDYRIRNAALVAETFGLDPVLLLEEVDPFKALVRLAAHNAVQNEHEKAAKRANRGKGGTG